MGGSLFGEDADGLGLVCLDADDCLRDLQPAHHLQYAVQHLVRRFHHLAVVGGDVRFTLGGVDRQRVHLLLRGKLHVGGEACAAHAHQTALPNGLEEACLVGDLRRLHVGTDRLLAVRGDLHHGAGSAVGHPVGGDCLYRAGYAGVDRHCHKGVGISDLLSHLHRIPWLHHRRTRRTDVHAHRNPHQFRQRKLLGCAVLRVLMVIQTDTM